MVRPVSPVTVFGFVMMMVIVELAPMLIGDTLKLFVIVGGSIGVMMT
jgi:hypothetical protein